MAPRGRSSKASEKSGDAEAGAAADERNRLRLATRARGTLTAASARDVGRQTCALPAALRRADGADIVKRNAKRRRKYLLVFPGHFSVSPGARVGTLRGLDSRTPALDVEFGAQGRLRFRGALVFPKNALISVRARRGLVSVEDIFETLVVFAEWAWLGTSDANPGDIPVPLPASLRKQLDSDPAFAAAQRTPNMSRSHVSRTAAVDVVPRTRRPSVRAPRADDVSLESDSGSDDAVAMDTGDEDDYAYAPASVVAEDATPRRSMPSRREGKRVDYSNMCQPIEGSDGADDDDEDDDEDNENDDDKKEDKNDNKSDDEIEGMTEDDSDVKTPVRATSTARKTPGRRARIDSSDKIEVVSLDDVGQAMPRRNPRRSLKPMGSDGMNLAKKEEVEIEDLEWDNDEDGKCEESFSSTKGHREAKKYGSRRVDVTPRSTRTRRRRSTLFDSDDDCEEEVLPSTGNTTKGESEVVNLDDL